MAKREIPEINAGSMADIAFLLLIFFIIMSLMANNQTPLDLPKAEQTTPPVDVEQRDILAIRANSKNELMVRKELMSNADDISERVVGVLYF